MGQGAHAVEAERSLTSRIADSPDPRGQINPLSGRAALIRSASIRVEQYLVRAPRWQLAGIHGFFTSLRLGRLEKCLTLRIQRVYDTRCRGRNERRTHTRPQGHSPPLPGLDNLQGRFLFAEIWSMESESKRQPISRGFVIQSIGLGLSFVFLAAIVAVIAIEYREFKRAEAEYKWRDAQCITP